jgi:FeS assembly SUF system regulator
MLKISRLTDYGTVILARLACAPTQQYTATELSHLTHLPAATVRKLLKQLHGHGLVDSTRGLHGGYRLSRAPEQITAAQVLTALEGPVALTECAQHATHCGIEGSCGVGRAWQKVNGRCMKSPCWNLRASPRNRFASARSSAVHAAEPCRERQHRNRRTGRAQLPARLRHRH